MEVSRDVTPACKEGHHDVCRCLLPGQHREWAGVIMGNNGEFDALCECWCHDGDLERELSGLEVHVDA